MNIKTFFLTVLLIIPTSGFAQALPRVEILGQSQTQSWFNLLELPVYQGRFVLGTGFYQWAEPDNEIWDDRPLTVGDATPPYFPDQIEIVIATIGSPPATGGYAASMQSLISQIKQFYPNVQRILLMPLVSGPAGRLCMVDGQVVASTLNRAAIERSVNEIAARDATVEKGAILEVRNCNEFSDSMGHVSFSEAGRLAQVMTSYYFSLGR